jgi:hypothetical protein
MRKLLLLIALIPTTALAAPQPLTDCGQTVEDAVLTADLDCSAFDGPAVTMAGRANLDLAGFTLTGSLYGAAVCTGRCTIEGGGSVVAPPGLDQNLNTSFAVITSETGKGRVSLSGIEISGYSMLVAAGRVELSSVALASSRGGIAATRVAATDTTFTNCELPISCDARASLTDVTIVGAGTGAVFARRVALSGTSITMSDGFGVVGERVTAEGSTLTDNCQIPSDHCADIKTNAIAPRLTDTVCETSLDPSGESWGVCTLD